MLYIYIYVYIQGGGGRGQKAKDYLELNGYTNVVNGAGPKETELWKIYGDK